MIETILFIIVLNIILLGSLFLTLKHRRNFEYVARVFIILMLTHILLIQLESGIPLVLLYGPFILLLFNETNSIPSRLRKDILHFVPFVFFTILYSLFLYGYPIYYYPLYLAVCVISLFGYASALWFYGKTRIVKSTYKDSLIYQLIYMNMVAAIFVLLILLKVTSIISVNLGTDIDLFLRLILFLSSLLIVRYLVITRKKRVKVLEGVSDFQVNVLEQLSNLSKYRNVALNKKDLLDYENRITIVLEEKKLYLSQDLSLERLAQETDIPKHHFSQLFSIQLKTSFYQLIANYRIAHAVTLLDMERNITFESLAYECGFNSKSSFNRYFKEITGCTPSEYLNSKSE